MIARIAILSVVGIALVLSTSARAHGMGISAPGAQTLFAAGLLQIPDAAFSPATSIATGTHTCNGVMKNDNEALTDPKLWPRVDHSTGYDTWGRVTGYCQTMRWIRGTHHVTFRYAASVFRGTQGAQQAQQDASKVWASSSTAHVESCPSAIAASCVQKVQTKGTHFLRVDEIRYQQCLGEVEDLEIATTSTERSQMERTLLNIDQAALVAMAKACSAAAPTFSFDGVQPLNAQKQSQTTFRAGEPGYLRVAWHVKHLQQGTKPVSIKVTYEVPAGNGWKVFASPLPIQTVARPGANAYLATFMAPASYPAYRFTVTIHLLGRWSKPKSATISVRH